MDEAADARWRAEWWDRSAAYHRRLAGRFPGDFRPGERDELVEQARDDEARAREWRTVARELAAGE